MKKLKHLACIVMAAVMATAALQACCSQKKTAATAASPDQQATAETAKPHRTYTVINFEGSAEGIGISGQMRMAQDSLIWLNVGKIMELGRAIASPDSVLAYSSLLGQQIRANYTDLQRDYGVKTSFVELQRIALGDGLEAYISQLAKRFGYNVNIKVTRREQVDHLSFPFRMPAQYR